MQLKFTIMVPSNALEVYVVDWSATEPFPCIKMSHIIYCLLSYFLSAQMFCFFFVNFYIRTK